MALIKVLVCVMVALAVTEAAIAPGYFRGLVQPGKYGGEQNCQCMNWRNCDGEINSDVSCPGSYVMVCCIRPTPEPIPEFIPKVERV